MSDMVPEQYKSRVYAEVMKSATPENLKKAIKEKRKELYGLKAKRYGRAAIKGIKKSASEIYRMSKEKLKNKQVLRAPNRVTVVENQPVYSKDKSRFFKATWEEEKRQLFFT